MKLAGKGKTVFVGLSGGVDSSVAAARLIKQGYKVVGVFIKVWHPDWMVCDWETERLDAMRVAAHLDIPFLTCDAEAAYRDDVATYFIKEYEAGRTPNPDVMCNQHVKFGRFLEFALEKGADFIATGHYAQRIETEEIATMYRGGDANKDQTYFLWTLSNKQLSQSLFPVGDTPKEDIRIQAEQLGIPVATKKDSQGICFLGHIDIAEFLSHYIDLVPGDVLDVEGACIGRHQGALVYTNGQRHGFTIETQTDQQKALYVVARDIDANTITVASTVPVLPDTSELHLRDTVVRQPIQVGEEIEFQYRYRQTPHVGIVTQVADTGLIIVPQSSIPTPAAGQSCVLYRGSLCVGGGILS